MSLFYLEKPHRIFLALKTFKYKFKKVIDNYIPNRVAIQMELQEIFQLFYCLTKFLNHNE